VFSGVFIAEVVMEQETGVDVQTPVRLSEDVPEICLL
jgi:hypothetical protein